MKNNKIITEDNRIIGSLFGFFVGDALGVPVEFVGRGELKRHPVSDMTEFGTHNQPLGTWSDDSSMVIATMDSLITNQNINYESIMDNFLKWYTQNEYTPLGHVFDIGNSTSLALLKYKHNKPNHICGVNDIYANGNGSLMRILPVSLYLHYHNDDMFDVIKNVSSMTHAHIYSIFSCYIYTIFINEYLKVLDKEKAYLNMQKNIQNFRDDKQNTYLGDLDDLKSKFQRIIYNDIRNLPEDDIKSSGYVIDSLEASFWCFLKTDNYKDAVLKAVNLGDDTDTIGALTGALAGLAYGKDSIPENWLNNLQRKEYLNNLVSRFTSFLK